MSTGQKPAPRIHGFELALSTTLQTLLWVESGVTWRYGEQPPPLVPSSMEPLHKQAQGWHNPRPQAPGLGGRADRAAHLLTVKCGHLPSRSSASP
jgi:hypothetical protein